MYNNSAPRRRWKRLLSKVALLVAVVLFISFIGGYTAWSWYQANLKAISSSSEEIIVTIPTGSTPSEIASILHKSKLIRSERAFNSYVRNKDLRNKLQAGTYRLRPSMTVPQIVEQIVSGIVASDLLTILPGQRLDQIKQAFVKAGYSEQATEEAFNATIYKDHPALSDLPALAGLEGYLYPESFLKTSETEPEAIIKQSLDEMQKRLTPMLLAGFERQGLSVHKAVTLASIIEKEVNNEADRKIVAQVFLKRLKIGMQLGSDVTFFYAAAMEGKKASPELDSPYNTRKYDGLPPGPISNVSESSLNAVANPSLDTDFLYFVSGDDGKTYFSKTVEEHEALTAQHCKKLCELPQ